jgi:glycosyltransferase involved in cell wall biosynthesis
MSVLDPRPSEDDLAVTEELARLRWELAGLASSLNGLRRLRLIRLFDRYRTLRHGAIEAGLRLRYALRKARAGAASEVVAQQERFAGHATYDVLLFSFGDWQWRIQRPQHLAGQWAAHGHRVFFMAPDFRPASNPKYTTVPARPFMAEPVQERIWEVHLGGLRMLNPLSDRLLEGDTQRLLAGCEALRAQAGIEQAVCLVELPFWGPLALRLRGAFGWKVVYDCVDRFYGVFPQAHAMLANEPELVCQADLVTATAQLLADDVADRARQVLLVPNAADPQGFARPARDPLPLMDLQPPIVGYVGALNAWFDAELIAGLARRHPEWAFVIVGSGTHPVPDLDTLPNVRLTGEVAYDDLPAYVHAFNVCLIPFKALPVIAATDPVKLYEYLAAGKPVVATDLPELHRFGELVYRAEGPDGFEAAITRALAEDSEICRARRTEFARENSWEARFGVLDNAINLLLGQPVAARRVHPVHARRVPPVPQIARIEPAAVRVPSAGRGAAVGPLRVTVYGRGLTPACQALLDEDPLPTEFIDSGQLVCILPATRLRRPCCQMVSVVDRATWKQSNRRLFLVEGL